MKVYCGNCKHFEYAYTGIGLPGYCHHPDNTTYSEESPESYLKPASRTKEFGNPKKINAKNDCKNFKKDK